MAEKRNESLELINEALALILQNKPCQPLPVEIISSDLRPLALKVNELDKYILELNNRLSQHQERESELKKDLFTDALTGIYNRRAFDNYAGREWNSAIRHKFVLSALMIDIDFFKNYNDTYGHHQGDVCLRAVAQCIKSILKRSTDIFARYGGEEFVAILPNVELEPAIKLAEKIRRAIGEMKIAVSENTGIETSVTVSIGVATCLPTPNDTETFLCQQADIALYQAKKSGRNCVKAAIFR